MHFDHLTDYHSRYCGKFVRYLKDGEIVPMKVVDVTGNEHPFTLHLMGLGNGETQVPVDSPDVILDYSCNFYVIGSDGKGIRYFSRTPDRQWSQGFRVGQYRSEDVVLSYDAVFRTSDIVRSALVPKFSTFADVLQDDQTAHILSSKLAVSHDKNLYYRSRKVGTVSVKTGTVHLFKEALYLEDQLRRMQIPCEVNKYTKKQMSRTYSFQELIDAGIEPPAINEPEQPRNPEHRAFDEQLLQRLQIPQGDIAW